MTETIEKDDVPTPKTYTQAELDELVGGLKSKVDELLTEKKSESEKRKNAEDEAKRIAEETARRNGDLASIEASWQERLTNTERELSEKYASAQATIQKLTVGQTATNLSNDLAVSGSSAVLLPHLLSRLTLDENNNVRVLDCQGQLSAHTLDMLKQEFRQNPAFAPLIKASESTGGGASGGLGGGATKKPSEYTVAEMKELRSSNPALYNQLFPIL